MLVAVELGNFTSLFKKGLTENLLRKNLIEEL